MSSEYYPIDVPPQRDHAVWFMIICIAVMLTYLALHGYPMSAAINGTHAMMVAQP
jgi:hypothetical protein